MYIPYIDKEIKLVILNKKGATLLHLKEHGMIDTLRWFKSRYKCGLKQALDYIRKVEGEMKSAKSN